MTTPNSPDVPSTASGPLLRWLWSAYLKKHTGTMAIAVFFMLLEGSMLGALSYMMQPMFDDVFVAGDGGMLVWVGIFVVGIFLVRATASVAQKLLLIQVSLKTSAALRIDLLDRIMLQDGAFHQVHPPGYLIQRVQGDVGAVGDVWRAIITGAGRDFLGLLVLLGVAISVDPIWALLACIGIPVLVLPAATAQSYVRRQARKSRDLGANLSTRLDEVFHGIVQVKLNALERYQARQYRSLTDRFVTTETKTAFGSAAIPAMIDIISGVGFMAVILYGGSEIISGEKTIGQFMTFFTAMGFAFDPMRRLGAIAGLWQTAAASIERVKELLDAPISLSSPPNPSTPPVGVPEITLENVSLSYGDTRVLKDVSLVASPGETTALVGASGAGKSSIFNLLTRLIDAQEGTVRVGGVPTSEMDLDVLRGLYSVVTQEALLFDESLRENILLGQSDIPEEKLKAALDAAHVSDFLPQLPNGLDTHVGPRGSALSGGQRQRVVIARALLRDTPVLLLDEATSALDAQSEKVVQDALDRLSAGRTTLVIAHRLSTIRGADKIIVMDRGEVKDTGTHEELLERGGIYADLYRLQFKDGKTVIDRAHARALGKDDLSDTSSGHGWLARIRARLIG
ncbi:ABC transporter ATP-binding protein [Tateyamaria armeniaca]|uniref:ABC transporter ATP-binding protein n=1 Tax=Tateyamaria armeniaca TaxID=2518930 RepID=A0ABW8UY52_9RHOB